MEQPDDTKERGRGASSGAKREKAEAHRQNHLNEHDPMTHHDRITSQHGNPITQPIVGRGQVPLHYFRRQIPIEDARMIDLVEGVHLLHRVIGGPAWVKPVFRDAVVKCGSVTNEKEPREHRRGCELKPP